MAPERRLIPQDDNAARIQCTSNVVGVIPSQIHEVINAAIAADRDPSSPPCPQRGRIDDHGSGISFLLGQGQESNVISLWEHSTQTLSEELAAPSGLCVKLTHPEHFMGIAEEDDDDDDDGIVGSVDLLVACLGPNAAANDHRSHRSGGLHGRSLRHVYAASPTTGVLCVWVLDNQHHQHQQQRSNESSVIGCDASVRLKLKPGEVLTTLTPMTDGSSDGNTAWLLAATSLGRLWKIYKTSRPLTLHAKLVKRKLIVEGGAPSEEEEEESGIVKGLYNYFTTPSKKSVSHDENAMDEGKDNTTSSDDDETIVALIPLLPMSNEGENGLDAVPKSPRRTPARSPIKQRRIAAPSVDTACAHAISLSSSLVVKEWQVSLSAGQLSEDGSSISGIKSKEGYTSRVELFPHHEDGTLNLESLKSNNRTHDEVGLVGYRSVDILAPPSLAKDGRSLLLVIRIEKEDEDATRVYVLRLGLVPPNKGAGGDQNQERSSPYILDAVWLDQYSGQSLSSGTGGSLECAGLVAAEVEEQGLVAHAGSVAYVGFGPRGDIGGYGNEGQPCPVTITAVQFPSVDESPTQKQPQIKDLDLYANIVPSVVQNSMSYDSLTGGCVFLATSGLLGGASVRFPLLESLTPQGTDSNMLGAGKAGLLLDDEALLRDESVLTIKSHLQSAFRQYLSKIKDGSGGSNPARAVIPPSIRTCTSQVLTAAVMLASKDYTCASSTGSSTPFSPKANTSPVTALRDKLEMHKAFVNFLAHAGAYRKVSTAGRMRLRDHGEMIMAARALLIECRGYFAKVESAIDRDDDAGRTELAQVRNMVMDSLESADDVISLPSRWARLQQLIDNEDASSPLVKYFFFLTSSSICEGIGHALRYRQDESSPLYDIPSNDSSPLTWTSSAEMLLVLRNQLQAIQQLGESILSTSFDFETEKANMRQYVEDISASALSGQRDFVLREPDNEAAMESYEQIKSLSISLLRQYANSDDGNDLIALHTSLEHSFFEGIVQICHDHRMSWRYQGPFSDQEADERYDLSSMMSNLSSYSHLHQSRDCRTGLSFSGYVLRWYADRGLNAEVFEIGNNCPHDLTRYVRNDSRLSDLSWIQHLQDGGHEQATVGLLSLTTPVLFGEKQEGVMGLWEQDQMMSLAKLSNKLASAKYANSAVDGQRSDLIENNLTLVSAQRILQEDAVFGDEIALKGEDLIRLALEKIGSAHDVDEMTRFGICGLAIASAKPPDQAEAMANDASSIWYSIIQADIHTWKAIANENNMAVGGISEEDLIRRVEGTAFVGVLCDFLMTSSSGKKTLNVGFQQVRNQVFNALGSDELSQVLTLSAEIVDAAN